MAMLNIEPNIAQPDDFYEALIDMHRDLDAEQSRMANAHLILLLANHVGDLDVLREALRRARALVPGVTDAPGGHAAPDAAHDPRRTSP